MEETEELSSVSEAERLLLVNSNFKYCMITWSQMLVNSFWNSEISKDFAKYKCILIQTVSNYSKHRIQDSRYSDLRMTKNSGMAVGPRELLSTKESRLSFTYT